MPYFHEHEQPIQLIKLIWNYIFLVVYEINDANNFSKDSIDIDIPLITKYIDAVYQFYLDNSYLVSKDKFFFIILTNLSNDTFINISSGSIYEDKNKNNTNIKFTYLNAFGVESDFNEFSIKFEIKYVKKINQFYIRFKIYVWVILIFNFRL